MMSNEVEINGADATAGSIRKLLNIIGNAAPNNAATLMLIITVPPIQSAIIWCGVVQNMYPPTMPPIRLPNIMPMLSSLKIMCHALLIWLTANARTIMVAD